MQLNHKIISSIINGLAKVAPTLSAKLSYRLWTRTYRFKMMDKETPSFQSAKKEVIIVENAKIMTYSWEVNDNKPIVLLLHGWNGRATQLYAFANKLTQQGYSVIAFDAQGHGLSDGKATDILHTVAVIKKMSEEYGDFAAIIAHSFGSLAAVNAIGRGVVCKKLISISAPSEFSALLSVFSAHLGMTSSATLLLEQYVLHNFSISSLKDISITGIAPRLTIPCLVIHDKFDDRVPILQAEKILKTWSGAKLHKTEKLGHVRILSNSQVVEVATQFLT